MHLQHLGLCTYYTYDYALTTFMIVYLQYIWLCTYNIYDYVLTTYMIMYLHNNDYVFTTHMTMHLQYIRLRTAQVCTTSSTRYHWRRTISVIHHTTPQTPVHSVTTISTLRKLSGYSPLPILPSQRQKTSLFFLSLYVINPFTAPACKISGLKDTLTRL